MITHSEISSATDSWALCDFHDRTGQKINALSDFMDWRAGIFILFIPCD